MISVDQAKGYIGRLVQIEWEDGADWPYFHVVDVYPEWEKIKLRGADYPDGSLKHEGTQFTVKLSEIRTMKGLDTYHAAKNDAGKPRVGLMLSDFPNALRLVAEVSTFGAKKYAPSSWRTVPDAKERYWDAVGRHLLEAQGVDEESGLPALAHLAWNVLALLELEAKP